MKKAVLISLVLFAALCHFISSFAEAKTYGDYSYKILPDDSVEIIKYDGDASTLDIPANIDGLTVSMLGDSSFAWNDTLKTVTIPESVVYIGNHAFAESTSLEEVQLPAKLQTLGDTVFQGCIKLQQINLPISIVSIGDNPFDRCDSLQAIELSPSHAYYTVQDGVLYNLETNTLISYPSGKKDSAFIVPDWVKVIGMAGFSENQFLNEITLPAGLTELEGNPFCGCLSLKNLVIPSENLIFSMEANTLINNRSQELIAYLWNDKESSYSVRNGILSIGQEAFYKHPEINTIYLPDSVTEIKAAAFAECTGLTFISLPDSLIRLGNDAFNSCTNLRAVNLPEGLTSIEDSVFYKCANLRSITLPKSLQFIGTASFYLCARLSEIIIPDGVIHIGNYAFAGAYSLKSVDLPSSLISIGESVFLADESLVLTVEKGSFAEEWADENGINYTYGQYDFLPTELI